MTVAQQEKPGVEIDLTISVPKYDEDTGIYVDDAVGVKSSSLGREFVRVGYHDPIRISDLRRALSTIETALAPGDIPF
jgi:hypothetical protein